MVTLKKIELLKQRQAEVYRVCTKKMKAHSLQFNKQLRYYKRSLRNRQEMMGSVRFSFNNLRSTAEINV